MAPPGLIGTLAQLPAWRSLLWLSMTWRWKYLTESNFLSTTSLAWSLALHSLFCFSQKKPLRWKEINTHTHTHTHTEYLFYHRNECVLGIETFAKSSLISKNFVFKKIIDLTIHTPFVNFWNIWKNTNRSLVTFFFPTVFFVQGTHYCFLKVFNVLSVFDALIKIYIIREKTTKTFNQLSWDIIWLNYFLRV